MNLEKGSKGHRQCYHFLASDETGCITGQQIVVGDGQIIPESPEAIEEICTLAGERNVRF